MLLPLEMQIIKCIYQKSVVLKMHFRDACNIFLVYVVVRAFIDKNKCYNAGSNNNNIW